MKTTMTMTLTEPVQVVSRPASVSDIQSCSQVGGKGLQQRKERKERKEKLTQSVLKKHLKYIVPELKLALIKEPGVKLHSIHGPQEIERLIEPMKFYLEEHFVTFHLDVTLRIIWQKLANYLAIFPSSAKIRITEVRPIPSFLAIADLFMPS